MEIRLEREPLWIVWFSPRYGLGRRGAWQFGHQELEVYEALLGAGRGCPDEKSLEKIGVV